MREHSARTALCACAEAGLKAARIRLYELLCVFGAELYRSSLLQRLIVGAPVYAGSCGGRDGTSSVSCWPCVCGAELSWRSSTKKTMLLAMCVRGRVSTHAAARALAMAGPVCADREGES